jgi:hypothetical protein
MKSIVIALLGLLSAMRASPDALYLYEETTGASAASLLIHMTGAKELSLIFTRNTSVMELSTRADMTTRSVKFERKDGSRFELRRAGDAVAAQTPAGERSFNLEGLPWYQAFFCLGDFAVGAEDRLNFQIFSPGFDRVLNDIGFQKLVAIREKKETIQAGGRTEQAWKIRITLPDPRSLFWSALYWYRASDGRVLRYEEVRGLPGTPPTIGLLKQEWLE